jgi:glycosyltransferase involved in cell wall biosynthesis
MPDSPPLLSIIIPNYNYEKYIGATIDSALALDWARKEIVVVDDGSTDRSLDIIKSYGDRIKYVAKGNGGQRSAVNAAFPLTTGELIYILDSDDLVTPEMARETIPLFEPGVAKIQFCLRVIDGEGRPIGSAIPNFPADVSHEKIIHELLTTALYPCPPTSGNIYSRRVLEKLFPIPEQEKLSSDSFLNTLSPLYGRVVSVDKILASYRTHDSNSWGTQTFTPSRFARMVRNDLAREAWLRERVAADGRYKVPTDSMNEQSMLHMQYRLVSRRFVAENHPVATETVGSILRKGMRACLAAPNIRLSQRLLMLFWYAGVALMPRPVAFHLARMRFSPGERPQFLRQILQNVGVLRRT